MSRGGRGATRGGRRRILVAMSGGVDSSVAAAMLARAGHEVIGATMKTFCYGSEEAASPRTCCGLDGVRDARAVADRLGVPHYVFDVEREFARDVMDDFVSEYARGRTPNPCVRCNSNTKFRDLLRRGRALGCDGVASGHYARLERPSASRSGESEPTPRLLRGLDASKDQSYFLWGLPRRMLDVLHLPLGGLTKSQVRERARDLDLVTADKPESQEICFVPTGRYRDFLEKKLLPTHDALSPGPIVDSGGRLLGRHGGYASFTVGQRRGLPGGLAEPHFVLEIRPETREVVVGPEKLLDVCGVTVRELSWLADPPSQGGAPKGARTPGGEPGRRLSVQMRHRAASVPCRVAALKGDVLELALSHAARAVAPGQSAVLYDGDRVLGGGRIDRVVTTSCRPPRRTAAFAPPAPR